MKTKKTVKKSVRKASRKSVRKTAAKGEMTVTLAVEPAKMGLGGKLGGGGSAGAIPEFATEADAVKAGAKGKVKIGGVVGTLN